ncbi:MAG: extracellular solute-binding protein [Myxococcota bacterium]|nr:extracellular solute-binding protein [Myxococcota bacterium]
MLLLIPALALAEPAELSVWHSYRGAEREALEQVLADYDAAHPELKVVPLAVPTESFASKLEAAAPRGNGPELFIAASERIGSWSASGIVEPLVIDEAAYHPVTVDGVRWQEQTWGVPLASKCLALYYNRDLVTSPPQTTDALLELAGSQRGGDRYGLAYEAASPYFNAAWLHGYGGGLFTAGAPTLDSPENAAAMAFVLGMVEGDLLPQEPTGALVTQLFNAGQAAMVINGPWMLGEIDPSVDFAIAPLPLVSETGQPAAPYVTVEAAFVSAYAKHPDEAAELARALGVGEAAIARGVQGRQTVAELAAWEDPRLSQDPILGAFKAQLDRGVPMPLRPEMGATWEPMAKAWRRVLRGAMPPEMALSAAQTELEIVTRPPPPAVDWRPYAAVLGLGLLGVFGWIGHSAWQQRREIALWRHAYAYVAPAALAMGALVLLPFIVGAGVSFFAHQDGSFTFVGIQHYLDIVLARDWAVTSPQSFWFTLAVTVLWTVANVVLHVGLGVGLAMLLREKWVRMRGVFRVLLILPWAIPNYITALIWKGMFHRQFGAINGLLVALGAEPVSWFGSFWTAFAANLTTNTWLGFPFMMVVTLGALQSIPRDLEDAAEVDGASGWQRFRHITLPLLRPALLPAVILGSVWTFNMFNVIYLVSGGEPDGSTEILVSEAYRWAFTRQHQYGYASAYAVLIFGVLLLYSRAMNRIAGQKVL